MSVSITIPEIIQLIVAIVLSLTILSGILFVTEPVFLKAKTMNNEMIYVEIISNENTRVEFFNEDKEIIVKSTDESYVVEVDDVVTFPVNGYTSNKKFTQQDGYVLLS